MLRIGRLTMPLFRVSLTSPKTAISAVVPVVAGIAVAACSTDFVRFDAPVLGYSGAKNEQTAAPIHSDGSLFEQRPDVGRPPPPSSDYGYAPSAGTGRVESSRLADAAPLVDNAPPRRPITGDYNRGSYSPASTVSPATASPALQSDSSGADMVVVRQGDTLYEIARRHGMTVSAIKRANGLTGNIIRPGQQLYLKAGEAPAAPRTVARKTQREPLLTETPLTESETYTVQRGDSLYAISRRTGIKVAALKQLNNIRDVRRMRPGTVLKLRDDSVARYASRNAGASIPSMRDVASPRETTTAAPALTGTKPIILNRTPSERISEPAKSESTRTPRFGAKRVTTTKVAAKQPQEASGQTGSKRLRWPVTGRIIRGFGPRADGTKNDGINIAVPIGTDIRAAEAGVVAYAGDELKGYGNLILIRHDNGLVSAYAHGDRMLVRRGDQISRGQVIAKAGKTGSVKQPQLHFELRKGAKPIDPMPYLGRM